MKGETIRKSITALPLLILMLPIFGSSCYNFNYSFFSIQFHDPNYQKQNEMVNLIESIRLIRHFSICSFGKEFKKFLSFEAYSVLIFNMEKYVSLFLEFFFTNFYEKLRDWGFLIYRIILCCFLETQT